MSGDDANAMILLEVILVAIIVLAVGMPLFLGARDAPATHDSARDWRQLSTQESRLLELLDALPPRNLTTGDIDPEMGSNLLTRLVRERFLDPASGAWQWDSFTKGTLRDPSIRTHLGYSLQGRNAILYGPNLSKELERGTEVVGDSYPAQPRWDATYPSLMVEPLNGAARMSAEAVFINDSSVQLPKGEAVRFRAYIGEVLADAEPVHVYGVVAQDTSSAAPMVELKWTRIADHDTEGQIAAERITAAQFESNLRFELTITPSWAPLPVGTRVRFLLEPGFESVASFATPEWSFDTASKTQMPDGAWLFSIARVGSDAPIGVPTSVAFRANPLPSASTDINTCLPAPPPCADPASALPPPFTRVHAWLSNGALARTTAVVAFPSVPADPTTPRVMWPTNSYAIQVAGGDATRTARFGVVLQNGASKGTINTLDIEIPGGVDWRFNGSGAGMFDPKRAVTWSRVVAEVLAENKVTTAPYGPVWTVESERLVRWSGRLELEPYAVATFLVDVPIRHVDASSPRPGVEVSATSFEESLGDYPMATLRFSSNGFVAYPADGPGAYHTDFGVTRFRVVPATAAAGSAGYPNAVGGGGQAGRDNFFTATLAKPNGVTQTGPSKSGARYEIAAAGGTLTAVESGAVNATLEVLTRVVAPGGTAVVSVDFSALAARLQATEGLAELSHRGELYGPASLYGRPVAVFEEPIAGTLAAAVGTIHSLEFTSSGAGEELVVTTANRAVHGIRGDAGVPPGRTPEWTETIEYSTGVPFRSAVGDLDPQRAGLEIVVMTTDGWVTMYEADGDLLESMVHSLDRSFALATDPAVMDGSTTEGRVYALGSNSNQGVLELLLTFNEPDGGLVHSKVVTTLPASDRPHGLQPFAGPGGDRRVLVVVPASVLKAYDGDSGAVEFEAPHGITADVRLTAAGDYDGNAANGDEILVVWSSVAKVYSSDGVALASWTPPAGTIAIANADASTHDRSAPELVVVTDGGVAHYVSMELPAPRVLWSVVVRPPATELPKIDGLQEEAENIECPIVPSDIDPDPIVCDAMPSSPGVSTTPLPSSALASAVRILHHPSGTGSNGLVVIVGVDALGRDYVQALDVYDNGLGEWGSLPLEVAPGVADNLRVIAPIVQPAGRPAVALAGESGRIYLLRWENGGAVWSNPVTPGPASGQYAYYVDVPEAALPGGYVLVAALEWDQTVAGVGVVHMTARLTSWFEVSLPDGTPRSDRQVIPVILRAWREDWEREAAYHEDLH